MLNCSNNFIHSFHYKYTILKPVQTEIQIITLILVLKYCQVPQVFPLLNYFDALYKLLINEINTNVAIQVNVN